MTTTETISAGYRGLDSWGGEEILAAFVDGQAEAIEAVRNAAPAIVRAADAIVARVGDTGRIVYVGAGSSGLIAALDGMELGGTFGWPNTRIAFVLANGTTLSPGMDGAADDDEAGGRAAMTAVKPARNDAVIAVTASGATPYTLAAVAEARNGGALIVGLANNAGSALLATADVPVLLASGAEIIAGSTRMNAGTAQKAALNMLSSLIMVRLGHVYDGHMVNLRVDNAKLRRRALAMLTAISGRPLAEAERALDRCEGSVKNAALVLRGLAPAEAEKALAASGGNLRAVFDKLDQAKAAS